MMLIYLDKLDQRNSQLLAIKICIYITRVRAFIGDSSWKSKRGAVNFGSKGTFQRKKQTSCWQCTESIQCCCTAVVMFPFTDSALSSLPPPTFHPLYSYCPYHLFGLVGSNCSLYICIFYSYILLLGSCFHLLASWVACNGLIKILLYSVNVV